MEKKKFNCLLFKFMEIISANDQFPYTFCFLENRYWMNIIRDGRNDEFYTRINMPSTSPSSEQSLQNSIKAWFPVDEGRDSKRRRDRFHLNIHINVLCLRLGSICHFVQEEGNTIEPTQFKRLLALRSRTPTIRDY